MSARIRGQEAALSITVNDVFAPNFGLGGPLSGSFLKVKNFSTTPRIDQMEEGYCGETADDLDQQIHGYDIAFSIDELDASAIDFLSLIAFKELNSLAPPIITIAASFIYRDALILPRTEILTECILAPEERNVGGRKEYVTNAYKGKAKHRLVQVG